MTRRWQSRSGSESPSRWIRLSELHSAWNLTPELERNTLLNGTPTELRNTVGRFMER